MNQPTPVIVQIDISRPARALWLLRFIDYVLVLVGGSAVLANLRSLVVESASENLASLVWRVVGLGFVSFAAYTGWRNVGTIDVSAWRSLLGVALTLVFCSVCGTAIVVNGLDWKDQSAVVGAVGLVWIGAASLSAALGLFALPRLKVVPLGLRVVDVLQHLRGYLGPDRRMHKSLFATDSRRALVYACAGAALLFAWGLAPQPTSAQWLRLYYQLGQQIQLLGFFLLFRARLHLQVPANVLLATDKRAPILFLRSFDDDEKPNYQRADRAMFDFSLETRLANHFSRVGPFIAVGSPKDKLALPGAARAQLSDEQWQPQVLQWMRDARLILMYSGKTHWVNWELTNIVQLKRATDLILLLPEIKAWRRSKRSSEIRARAEQVRATFKDTPWQEELEAFDDFAGLRAMLFGPDGSMVMIKSRTRSRDSYHLAALIAHMIWVDPSVLWGKLPAVVEPAATGKQTRLRKQLTLGAIGVAAVGSLAAFSTKPDLATDAVASLEYAMSDRDERRELMASAATERGNALLEQQQFAAAQAAFQAACDIRRELAERPNATPAAQYQLATSFQDLGELALSQHQLGDALSAYQRMSKAALAAANAVPDNLVSRRALFVAYNHIGVVLVKQGTRAEALRAHAQALEFAQTLANKQPENAQARADLFTAIGAVAGLEYLTKDYAGAQKHYETLLVLYRDENLEALRDHAQSVFMFGMVLEALDKLPDAQQAFANSAVLRSRVAEHREAEPDDHTLLAATLQKAAAAAVVIEKPDVARAAYARALEVQERVLARNPSDSDAQRTKFELCHALGRLLVEQDSAQARSLFEAALELGIQLAQSEPHAVEAQSNLAATYFIVGSFDFDAGKFAAAQDSIGHALEIRRRLAADEPSALESKRVLAETLDSLGDAMLRAGKYPEALELYAEHVTLRKAVVDASSENQADLRELLTSTSKLASAQKAVGQSRTRLAAVR